MFMYHEHVEHLQQIIIFIHIFCISKYNVRYQVPHVNKRTWQYKNYLKELTKIYGSGHEIAAVLLPGFAINW